MSTFRVVATIVALALAVQALSGLVDPAPDAPRAMWNLLPVAFAIAALALVWRARPAGLPTVLMLFAAAGTLAFTLFGDSAFARAAAGAILAMLAACVGWLYVVLPLLAWRRGRWPVDPIAFAPLDRDAALPEQVEARVRALAEAGFTPRLVHARAEGNAAATIVIFTHGTRDALASVTHIAINGGTFTNTRLMHMPGRSRALSLIDAAPPAPFPPAPGQRVLLFPGADAQTLLAHFARLDPDSVPATPLSDADLAAAMATITATHERWLVEAGYLAKDVQDEQRRYTLKGGFSAVLRPLWPWATLERARLAREGRDALRGGSGAGAS